MTAPYVIELPWPESINGYFLNAKRVVPTLGKGGKQNPKAGKTYIGRMLSPEGKLFRGEVLRAVRAGHRLAPRLHGRLSVMVYARPPAFKRGGTVNNNRRDLDNLWKCLLDALTKAEVVLDDCLFDDCRIVRGAPIEKGRIWVAIHRFDPESSWQAVTESGILAETPLMAPDLFSCCSGAAD